MAKINLLPWREELREKRKKQFVAVSSLVALIGVLFVGMIWFFYDQKLSDQEQANQLIVSTNQSLDEQLKSLEGLQEKRNQIIERMKLIQGLQSQRPIVVRLIDELARVTPENVYITRFTRSGNKFTFEGQAESPNAVAEFLRNLEASSWYRNAFMNSYLAGPEPNKTKQSVVPRPEVFYGTFVVTADLDEPSIQQANEQVQIVDQQVSQEPTPIQPEISTSEVAQ
jgi:type IV pilus assembly protein PilN